MLEFNTQVNDVEAGAELTKIDPEGLLKRMVAAGYLILEVSWEDCGRLKLGVEDDVMFLCEAFLELPSFIQLGKEQNIFLGDGLIDMVARRAGEVVHVSCTHTPFLHRALSKTREYTVPVDAYVGAWTRLIRGLVDLADQPPSPAARGMTRLESVSPTLADSFNRASSDQCRRAALAACELVVTFTGLEGEEVGAVLEVLRLGGVVRGGRVKEQIKAMAARLDEAYLRLDAEGDESKELERLRLSSKARAASALVFAMSEDALQLREAVYEAMMAVADPSELVRAVGNALRS